MSKPTKDNFWQVAGVAVLGLIALSLVFNGVPSSGGTMMNGYGYMGYYMGNNNSAGLITGILVFAIQIFKLLLVVGLIFGTICMVKKYVLENKTNFSILNFGADESYACPNCQTKLDAEFKFCPNCKATLKKKCTCGTELQVGWMCCPNCGNKINN